jgi:hypothetical protein
MIRFAANLVTHLSNEVTNLCYFAIHISDTHLTNLATHLCLI